MSDLFRASCTCGNVTFQSAKSPVIQLTCHCSDCREATGSDFSNLAFFRAKAAEITGEVAQKDFIAASGSGTQRDYCSNCQTLMFDRSDRFPQLIGIFAQQLEAPFEFNPAAHIWVKNKLPHVKIPNGKQFDKDFTR